MLRPLYPPGSRPFVHCQKQSKIKETSKSHSEISACRFGPCLQSSAFKSCATQAFRVAYTASKNTSHKCSLDRLLDSWERPQRIFPQNVIDEMKSITGRAPTNSAPAAPQPAPQAQPPSAASAIPPTAVMPGMMPPQAPGVGPAGSMQMMMQQPPQQQQMMPMMSALSMSYQQPAQQPVQQLSAPAPTTQAMPVPQPQQQQGTVAANGSSVAQQPAAGGGSKQSKRKRGDDHDESGPKQRRGNRAQKTSSTTGMHSSNGVGTSTKGEDPSRPSGPISFKDRKELKQRHEAVVQSLYDTSAHRCEQTGQRFSDSDAYREHLDTLVMRRKRKKEGFESPSRSWFVTPEQWIIATAEGGSRVCCNHEHKIGRVVYSNGKNANAAPICACRISMCRARSCRATKRMRRRIRAAE